MDAGVRACDAAIVRSTSSFKNGTPFKTPSKSTCDAFAMGSRDLTANSGYNGLLVRLGLEVLL